MAELREAIAIEEQDTGIENDYLLDPALFVEICESLVTYDESSAVVRLAHYTVHEFIRSHCLDKLFSDAKLTKPILSYLSFEYLAKECPDYRIPLQRVQDHPFGNHAAMYWVSHAKRITENLLKYSRK